MTVIPKTPASGPGVALNPPRTRHDALRKGLGARLFASLQKWGSRRYEPLLHLRKQALLGGLHGALLEIGAGTGVNFDYYSRDVRWIGLDPNAHMHRHLRARARSMGLGEVDIRAGVAEHIPLPADCVDVVVGTLVLCSVRDLQQALVEVKRVLKPGGRFVFIEHVAAPKGSSLRRAQTLLRPACRWLGDGCTPDRRTLEAIQDAGFTHVEAERFDVPLPIVAPHIAGVAIK